MKTIILGVVADTHVPDRASRLHPSLLECFREQKVEAILHAGDVCTPGVLTILGQIAPVYAVRGNRDIFWLRKLPMQRTLDFNNISIGLVHGHGRLHDYLLDRIHYYLGGLDIKKFCQRAIQTFPGCQVIVFGHIHYSINQYVGNQFLFNPGSACCADNTTNPPSAGLLYLHPDGSVQGKIFTLR